VAEFLRGVAHGLGGHRRQTFAEFRHAERRFPDSLVRMERRTVSVPSTFYWDLREAMSIEKRYFTSDLSSLS
jgi:hypothetical protein